MANHVQNDRGEIVIAVGAPGSLERVKIEYPALIERVSRHREACATSPGRGVDRAVEMIREAGVEGDMTTCALMEAAGYPNQGIAIEIIRRCSRREKAC